MARRKLLRRRPARRGCGGAPSQIDTQISPRVLDQLVRAWARSLLAFTSNGQQHGHEVIARVLHSVPSGNVLARSCLFFFFCLWLSLLLHVRLYADLLSIPLSLSLSLSLSLYGI